MKKILIAAGGTGGHIFPALAIANALSLEGYSVHWVGSCRPLEKKVIAGQYPIDYLKIEALRGKGRLVKLMLPWRLLRAMAQAIRIVYKQKPEVVLTMGSFVSGPVGLAAWLLRVPLVVHEQNSIPGMTNKFLSRISTVLLSAFADTFPEKKQAICVGNPLRKALYQVIKQPQNYLQHKSKLRLLVLGGSQGAAAINQTVAQWLEVYALEDAVEVWHQCGSADFNDLQSRYHKLNTLIRLDEFIDDISSAYDWADLVVSRAGALAVTEIAVAGLPSVLVPFPHAVDNHQYYNAKVVEREGGAVIVCQSDLTALFLANLITDFANNKSKLSVMSQAAAKVMARNSVELVLDQIKASSV
jgi:UDP-N-acetylglucosamine--N-acetylmuramyl-(pentapeptide) pyrophosphoryl-undecaprenol N-acetylglucosamine transferase